MTPETDSAEQAVNPMTEHVMTVGGPIAPDDLGFTLMHEHLLTRFWHATHRYDLAGMPEDERYIIDELAGLTATGCKSLVDVTSVGINRKPEALRDLAQRTGIQVVMGCGWYRDHYYPAAVEIDRRSVDSLADELVNEIEQGAEGTGVRRASSARSAPRNFGCRRPRNGFTAPPDGPPREPVFRSRPIVSPPT